MIFGLPWFFAMLINSTNLTGGLEIFSVAAILGTLISGPLYVDFLKKKIQRASRKRNYNFFLSTLRGVLLYPFTLFNVHLQSIGFHDLLYIWILSRTKYILVRHWPPAFKKMAGAYLLAYFTKSCVYFVFWM